MKVYCILCGRNDTYPLLKNMFGDSYHECNYCNHCFKINSEGKAIIPRLLNKYIAEKKANKPALKRPFGR